MKAIKFLVTMMLFGIALGVSAQGLCNPSKEAKKLAKAYKKQKWEVAPGGLPIECQVQRAYDMEFDPTLELGQTKYMFGTGISAGQFYDAAKLQASEVAKGDLVGNIYTEITRLVSAQVNNKQLSNQQAESVAGVVEKSKSLTVKRLTNILTVVELHRTTKEGNTEVMIRLAVKSDNTKNMEKDAKQYINDEVKKLGIDDFMIQ